VARLPTKIERGHEASADSRLEMALGELRIEWIPVPDDKRLHR